MQRNGGKSSEESRKTETANNRRQNFQRERDREADDRDCCRNRYGLSRYCNPPGNPGDFDAYHQQQLQQQFQEFQLAGKENGESCSSRSINRRMGAVLPSPTPPGSHQGRSSSVPPVRRDRYNQEQENAGASCESSILEFQGSNRYYETTRSPKYSVSRGNGGVTNNVDSEVDYYGEVDAATSTSTTNGKVKFLNKIFDKNDKEKSERSLKKDKKSSKMSSKMPTIRDVDTEVPNNGRSRGNDLVPYVENRKTPSNPFLEDEDDDGTYVNGPIDPRQAKRDASNASIKSRSSRQGGLQYVPRSSTNSFMNPSELNSNYDMIYAEARRTVDSLEDSTEMLPLPLEIPDSVTDEEAFRRYLSVRRGATCNHHLDHLPLLPFLSVPISQHANMGSTGEPGETKSSSRRASVDKRQEKMLPPGEAHKRTLSLSHAIMTLALLCASASQLRFFVSYSHAHTYPAINYFLVCTCIIIEILVGIGYLLLSRFSISEERAEFIHSFLIFGLFIVAAVNVIICAFALDDHICELIARNSNAELYDSIDQSMVAGKMK